MVQRKVSGKLGSKASPSLETEKKPQANMSPSIQSHDSKARGAELSRKKKSRSFKRSLDVDSLKLSVRRCHLSDQSPKQPPCSPVKLSRGRGGGGAAMSSPNYMKSTSCSEARKEQKRVTKTPRRSVIESTSKKLSSGNSHKVSSKSLNRTSSLKKVRNLKKAPSFKLSRCQISVNKCSKAALCENFDVKRATCSSTLKDSKFPPSLDLNPGGTESQGTSVMKVCPYNYCSLNGHKQNPAPPLKSFLSARRRVMKAQRTMKPVALSPCKEKPCKSDGESKEDAGVDLVIVNGIDKPAPQSFNEEKGDFYVEVYVKNCEDKAASISEIHSKDNLDQLDQEKESSAFIDMNSGKMTSKGGGGDGTLHECVCNSENFDWESSTSITLDALSAESSDMEWEEEGRPYLPDSISTPIDHTFVNPSENEMLCLLGGVGFKKGDVHDEFLNEFTGEEFGELSHDEIIDCHEQFSDSDSSTNNVYEETEMNHFMQDHGCPGDCDDMLVSSTGNEEKMKESSAFNEEIMEAPEAQDEIFNYQRSDDQTTCVRKSTEERLIDKEEFFGCQDDAANDSDKTSEETPEEQPSRVRDSEDENPPLFDMENSGFMKQGSLDSEEKGDSNPNKLFSVQDINKTEEGTETEELTRSTSEEEQAKEENKPSGNVDSTKLFKNESGFNHDPSNTCKSLNIRKGSRKQGDDSEALKSFNPREPNYLEVEPDPESEKVDLRHQEMDERRNSEEWMLDYALRKTVNQLAPARKKKVALLVEAFETVTPPVHNHETHATPI